MSKHTIYELEYSHNLIQNYQKISHLPGFVLLESSDQKIGRYDILSALPYQQLSLKKSGSDVENFFSLFQQQISTSNSLLDLPFQGGVIGYFSYDFAACLANIPLKNQPNLSEIPLVELGFYDWAIITDHRLKKVSLFAANNRNETKTIVEEMLNYWQKSAPVEHPFKLHAKVSPLINKIAYQEAFNAIYRELQRGRAYQVNYTQPFSAPYEGDSWQMYKQIRANNPVPYSAFLRTNSAEILSFSPERFLLMENNKLLTSPIKGTARRNEKVEIDIFLREQLLNCPKNRAENVMIVDLMRNDLSKIAKPASVYVEALCALESYEAVHHLVSHIKADTLPDISPVQAFATCFPGGSITGTPKLESMRIIAEQEVFSRGIYCGCIGYFSNHGRFDTNIAIRTITACNNILHLAAGGAVVIDSHWEEEYRECFTKIEAIIKGLGHSE